MTLDDAIRKMAGVPDDSLVFVEITGGGEVQIGDCTWDSEPTQIEVMVWANDGTRGQVSKALYSRTFNTLPELWEALHG
jgi:hypothetical protein